MEPISNDEITEILRAGLPQSDITVEGDGYQYRVTIVSGLFAGKNTLQRHKLVYALLQNAITEGRLHALSLSTKTPGEAA